MQNGISMNDSNDRIVGSKNAITTNSNTFYRKYYPFVNTKYPSHIYALHHPNNSKQLLELLGRINWFQPSYKNRKQKHKSNEPNRTSKLKRMHQLYHKNIECCVCFQHDFTVLLFSLHLTQRELVRAFHVYFK